MHGPHHREILERHLRRTVLADGHSGMRAGETDVGTRDRGHADEVIRAREERREGRREWHEADDLHPDRHRDHPLLGDVHLEEAIGGGLLEVLGVGRIAHLSVERHDVRARGSERRDRLPVRLTRCYGLGVAPEVRGPRRRKRGRPPRRRARHLEHARWLGAELRQRLLRLLRVECLAMPARFVFQEGDALALHGLRDDRVRSSRRARAFVRVVDLREIVAIDHDPLEAECLHARRVRVGVPLELGRPALTEAVHVEDRGDVLEAFMAGEIEGLPDRALGRFAVADDDPHVERRPQ